MKYYTLLNELFLIYEKINNSNKINHIFDISNFNNDNKFESIYKFLEIYVKNSELECDFRYFSINWSILEDYYYNIEKELKENNISYSYSVDAYKQNDCIEEAFIYVINYLYEFLLLFEYYTEAYIYRLKFKKYIT